MEYDMIAGETVAEEVLRQGVLAADLAAFVAEIELARLRELSATAPTGQRASLGGLTRSAAEAARLARRKARRKLDHYAVEAEELQAQREEWLRNWIGSMEREHASHVARRDERAAALALTGDDALESRERVEIKAKHAENAASITVIESALSVARAALAGDMAVGEAPDETPGDKA